MAISIMLDQNRIINAKIKSAYKLIHVYGLGLLLSHTNQNMLNLVIES